MALVLPKMDFKNVPVYAKVAIAVLPGIIIAAAVIFLLIMPLSKTIKTLDNQIGEQNNKIAESRAKVAKLDILMKESEKLQARLNELKELLPVEKEVSKLLKQLSDESVASGLEIKSWKPKQTPNTHPSGIVLEIPSDVVVTGTYHDFGRFLSSLTRTNRIVNVSTIRMGGPKKGRDPANTVLDISFNLLTFSAVPEGAAQKPAGK